jgi:methionyl-tRNA formyltransferase
MRNILFCGFGSLGTECISKLINNGYNVVYVLTHREEKEDSLDTFAIEKGIEFSYKDTRKHKDFFIELLQEKQIDYLVSVNYRYIIPTEIFSIPQYAINIHGSLLPKYRGRTPHVWSIINGEEYSGITCHLIDEGVDTGNIIEQVTVEIEPNDTGYSLLQKFQVLYPQILVKSLRKLEDKYETIPQNDLEASYYGKRTPDMGYIDFYKDSKQVINFVRAQAFPYPGAYYYLNNGQKISINKLEKEISDEFDIKQIGIIIVINNNYYVRCLDGILKLVDFKLSE